MIIMSSSQVLQIPLCTFHFLYFFFSFAESAKNKIQV